MKMNLFINNFKYLIILKTCGMYSTYIVLYHYYFLLFDWSNRKSTKNVLISESQGKNWSTLGQPVKQSNIYCLFSEGVIYSSDYM